MKNQFHILLCLFLCPMLISSVSAQKISLKQSEERLRLSFGLSRFTSSQVNFPVNEIERQSKLFGAEMSSTHFKDHIQYGIEFEHFFREDFSWLIKLEFHSESVGGYLAPEAAPVTEQQLDYAITFVSLGVGLVEYFPVFRVHLGEARLFAGFGVEVIYSNFDFQYRFDGSPIGEQKIGFLRTGYNPGGRLFAGFEVPVLEFAKMQVRTGYTLRSVRNPKGTASASGAEPVDPAVFQRLSEYNLSSVWFSFALGFAI
jgi:hypothetical protein